MTKTCCNCGKIGWNDGTWHVRAERLRDDTGEATHGLCPECAPAYRSGRVRVCAAFPQYATIHDGVGFRLMHIERAVFVGTWIDDEDLPPSEIQVDWTELDVPLAIWAGNKDVPVRGRLLRIQRVEISGDLIDLQVPEPAVLDANVIRMICSSEEQGMDVLATTL